MKKLEKLTLKELGSELNFIGVVEAQRLNGGYDNDCFWRCVSYIESGGSSYSISDAESYADSYFGSNCSNDASVTPYDIANYFALNINTYNPNFADGIEIVIFDTRNNVGNYANTGGFHAIVITGETSDGGKTFFDPQSGISGTLDSSDCEKLTYAGY